MRAIMHLTVIDPTPAPAVCELGRQLGNCALRQAGCGSLYDVLCTLYPPPALLVELRSRQDIDPDVARWLQRLENVGGFQIERNRHRDFA